MPPSDLEHFLEVGQIARAIARDECHVLETHAAEIRIIKPGLDSDHVARLQGTARILADARSFMNFEPHSMADAMKKSLHPAMLFFRWIILLFEKFHDRLVNIVRLIARLHLSECEL